jgi:hypothetical protein
VRFLFTVYRAFFFRDYPRTLQASLSRSESGLAPADLASPALRLPGKSDLCTVHSLAPEPTRVGSAVDDQLCCAAGGGIQPACSKLPPFLS